MLKNARFVDCWRRREVGKNRELWILQLSSVAETAASPAAKGAESATRPYCCEHGREKVQHHAALPQNQDTGF